MDSVPNILWYRIIIDKNCVMRVRHTITNAVDILLRWQHVSAHLIIVQSGNFPVAYLLFTNYSEIHHRATLQFINMLCLYYS